MANRTKTLKSASFSVAGDLRFHAIGPTVGAVMSHRGVPGLRRGPERGCEPDPPVETSQEGRHGTAPVTSAAPARTTVDEARCRLAGGLDPLH